MKTRVAFQANVLLLAMGAFRPGTLGKVRYRDDLLSAMRDPENTKSMKHASTITIPSRENRLQNDRRNTHT